MPSPTEQIATAFMAGREHGMDFPDQDHDDALPFARDYAADRVHDTDLWHPVAKAHAALVHAFALLTSLPSPTQDHVSLLAAAEKAVSDSSKALSLYEGLPR